jgi:hypothetical protein
MDCATNCGEVEDGYDYFYSILGSSIKPSLSGLCHMTPYSALFLFVASWGVFRLIIQNRGDVCWRSENCHFHTPSGRASRLRENHQHQPSSGFCLWGGWNFRPGVQSRGYCPLIGCTSSSLEYQLCCPFCLNSSSHEFSCLYGPRCQLTV